MSLIPQEELNPKSMINLAPMVDFLFLVLAVFATIAVTRTALYDSEVNLAVITPPSKKAADEEKCYTVVLSVDERGGYKWITEMNEFKIATASEVQKQLVKQQEDGLLPRETEKIKVLLHIDKEAQWQPIVDLVFKIREVGFDVHPVYEPIDQ
jgi:biopolymer transport protein ExbD